VLGRHDRPAMAWTPADERLADAIPSYWVSFAKLEDPNGSGLAEWPAFTETKLLGLHARCSLA
jgi:carboxylesterase type B